MPVNKVAMSTRVDGEYRVIKVDILAAGEEAEELDIVTTPEAAWQSSAKCREALEQFGQMGAVSLLLGRAGVPPDAIDSILSERFE